MLSKRHMRHFLPAAILLLAPVAASAEAPADPEPAPPTRGGAVVAEVVVETLSAHKLAVAIDSYDGLEGPDDRLDELLVFMSETPLEPISEQGLGLLRIEGGRATVVLPRARLAFLLSLSDVASPAAPGSAEGFTQHVLDDGAALAIHRPAESQTLAEALAAEAPRRRADLGGTGAGTRRRAAADWMPETKDDGSGSGGETCRSSCTNSCNDGSSCSTTCNATQCAECDCPASCYCRNRT